MKYLSKIYEEKYKVIADDEEIPEGYIAISRVDYMAASWATFGYFCRVADQEVVKVQSFEVIDAYEADSDYVPATEEQIEEYDSTHPA